MRNKKSLFLMAVLCCLFSCMLFTARAQAATQTGEAGDGCTYTLDSKGNMTITGYGMIDNYEKLESLSINVKHLVIGEGITGIGYSIFSFWSGLVDVKLPKTMSSIYREVFTGCDSLVSIDVAEGNPDLCSVDGVLFTADMETLLAFPGGRSGSYEVPDGVRVIGRYAFQENSKITQVILPDSLQIIDSNAFGWAKGIVNLEIPDSVYYIGDYAFCRCNLQTVKLPEGLKTIAAGTFYCCKMLTQITLPEGLEFIGRNAFEYSGLDGTLTIPASVRYIVDNPFAGCKDLTAFAVEEESSYFSCLDGILYSQDGTTLISYPHGKSDTTYEIPKGTQTIGARAFFENNVLTKLTIPAGCTVIERYAFYDADLSVVSIPSGMALIEGYAFSQASIQIFDYHDSKDQWNKIVFEDNSLDTRTTAEVSYTTLLHAGTFDISAADVQVLGSCTYDGNPQKPTVFVKYASLTTLEEGVDYTVSYSHNVNAGTGVVTITGKRNYYGHVSKTFTISQKDITVLSEDVTKTYDGAWVEVPFVVEDVPCYSFQYFWDGPVYYGEDGLSRPKVKEPGTYHATELVYDPMENYCFENATPTIKIKSLQVSNTIKASNVTKTRSTKSQSFTLSVTRLGSAKLSYKSSNSSVKVSSSGQVTIPANFVGSSTITITSAATSKYLKTTKKITVKVNPPKPSITKISCPSKGKIITTWSKVSSITKYQLQFSKSKSFPTGSKTSKIRDVASKYTKSTLTGFPKGTMYARVRTYKTVNGTKYYSSWSTVKYVKVK